MSTEQIEELVDGQKALQKSTEQLSLHILKLTTLISGNELDKHDRGMIGRLEKVEKNQEYIKKYSWMIVGAALVVGFILNYVVPLFKH